MRVILTIGVMAVAFLASVGFSWAQEMPMGAMPFVMPQPTTLPSVVAKVGDVEIRDYQVERIVLIHIPPGQMVPPSALAKELIRRELIGQFLKTNKLAATDEETQAKIEEFFGEDAKKTNFTVEQVMLIRHVMEEDVRYQIGVDKLIKQRIDDAAVEAFVEKNPDAFNGTTVKASHILIKSEPTDPTVDQLAAKKKAEGILADIKADKIKFADAAKQFSADATASQGGDLGEFEFRRMVFPFAQAAFGLKVGQMSEVVQSAYGFHIILVTGRTEGKTKLEGAALDKAKDDAKQVLGGKLETEIFSQPVNGLKVEVFVEEPEMPQFMME